MDTTQSRTIKVRRESDNKEMIVNLDDDNFSCNHSKRCSDFDNGCKDINNHTACWLGGVNHDYKKVTPIADGYCPFVQNCN